MTQEQNPSRSLSDRWAIPKPVWIILLSWGMAVLMIAALLSFWIQKNQRDQDAENIRVQRAQEQAMCAMLDLFTSGPPAPTGPAGDRSRAVVQAMIDYRATLHYCISPPQK